MSSGVIKWLLVGAGVLVMVLKVTLLMRHDSSLNDPGEPGDTR